MQTFFGVVHKDEESCFGIHFPDAPGCTSTGDTLEELLDNAIEALSLYFEYAEPVKARQISEIRADAEDDIREGAFLVAIPHIDLTGRTVRANITMDAGLLKGIDETAKKRGLTRSAFIAQATTGEIYGHSHNHKKWDTYTDSHGDLRWKRKSDGKTSTGKIAADKTKKYA